MSRLPDYVPEEPEQPMRQTIDTRLEASMRAIRVQVGEWRSRSEPSGLELTRPKRLRRAGLRFVVDRRLPKGVSL